MMREVGCKNWKLGSGEVFDNGIMNEILLKKQSECLVISSGLSTIKDIENNINYLKKKLRIMQCYNVPQVIHVNYIK